MAQRDVDGGGPITPPVPKWQSFVDKIQGDAKTAYNDVAKSAAFSANDLKNSRETLINSVSGEIKGGIQSLRSEADQFKDKLNNTTAEGLITDGVNSLKNMAKTKVNDLVASTLTSKLGAKLSVNFIEDERGNLIVDEASLVPDGNDTIASILKILTGLSGGTTSLQKIVTDTATSQVKAQVTNLVGKVGSKASAAAVKEAAKEAIKDGKDAFAAQSFTNVNNTFFYDSANTGINGAAGAPIQVTRNMQDATDFKNSVLAEIDKQEEDVSIVVPAELEIEYDEEGFKRDLAEMTGKDGQTVFNSINDKDDSLDILANETTRYSNKISAKSNNPELGLLEGISTFLFTDAYEIVQEIAPDIPTDVLQKVVALSQGDAADFSNAVRLVDKFSSSDYNTITTTLLQVNTSISDATKVEIQEKVFSDPIQIGENNDFSYISSVEELQAEFSLIRRDVDKIIVHWTETHTNRNIGSEEIDKWQEGIVYNLIIRRDGSIQRGLPFSKNGNHAPGYDENSLGVCFVGGINAPTGTPDYENFISAASLTRSQLNSFDHICKAFYAYYPGGTITGHNEVDETQEDPGFDVLDYVLARFGKEEELEKTPISNKTNNGGSIGSVSELTTLSTTTYTEEAEGSVLEETVERFKKQGGGDD